MTNTSETSQFSPNRVFHHILTTIKKHRQNIMFEHTIFALPFAYLGLFLAAEGWPGWLPFLWVSLAMVGARTAAMSFNRVIDARIDALNERTAHRPIPAGRLSRRSVVTVAVVGLGLMLLAAWQLNPLCFALSPIAVIALTGYSFTKRFTWLSHFVLGLTDAMAPAGGWLAVDPHFSPPMLLLSFAVCIWIAGFDVIYACQDIEFDRRHGLSSIPSRFGIGTALLVAKVCHVAMVATLVLLGLSLGMGWLYYVGVGIAAGLLVYEHMLISPHDMSKIHIAFFTVNSYIASVLFVFTLADLV